MFCVCVNKALTLPERACVGVRLSRGREGGCWESSLSTASAVGGGGSCRGCASGGILVPGLPESLPCGHVVCVSHRLGFSRVISKAVGSAS